jgi:hypothetical protein
MKLLIITCLKELVGDVSKIFKQANIDVFSTTEITGYREGNPHNLREDWFVSGSEQVDSMMIFTFIGDEKARLGIALIKKHNETSGQDFPIRAFMMPVEEAF